MEKKSKIVTNNRLFKHTCFKCKICLYGSFDERTCFKANDLCPYCHQNGLVYIRSLNCVDDLGLPRFVKGEQFNMKHLLLLGIHDHLTEEMSGSVNDEDEWDDMGVDQLLEDDETSA